MLVGLKVNIFNSNTASCMPSHNLCSVPNEDYGRSYHNRCAAALNAREIIEAQPNQEVPKSRIIRRSSLIGPYSLLGCTMG